MTGSRSTEHEKTRHFSAEFTPRAVARPQQ
jgi:hypothetical protein